MLSITVVIVTIMIWCSTGVLSLVYWWTSTNDFTTEQIPLAVFSAIMGPLSFFVGYIVHGETKEYKKPVVILTKRK